MKAISQRTVVILAAGKGSRISEASDQGPKPLLPLGGISLVERTIRSARRSGFRDFLLVVGFRGEEIRKYLKDGQDFGVSIRYAENREWDLSNGVSLLKAEPYVAEEFVLLMADHVLDEKIYDQVSQTSLGADDLVLFTDKKIESIYDLADATKVKVCGDRIVQIGKELTSYDAIDTGVFICSHRLFDALRAIRQARGDVSLSDGVRKSGEVAKARIEDIGLGWWQDVDTIGAFHHAEGLLRQA